jgi:serine/threonine protein phosphatase PrpC/ankyrin repeat protein
VGLDIAMTNDIGGGDDEDEDALSAALHAAALSSSSSNSKATTAALPTKFTATTTETLNATTHQQVDDGGGGDDADDDEVDEPNMRNRTRRRENDFWEFVAPRSRQSRDPPASPSSSLCSSSATNTAAANANANSHAAVRLAPPRDPSREQQQQSSVVPSSTSSTEATMMSSSSTANSQLPLLVECVHCGELTPFVVNHDGQPTTKLSLNAAAAADQESTPKSTMTNIILPSDDSNDYENYDHCEVNDVDDDDDDENERLYLQQRVLHAAYETALTNSGPTFLWEKKHDLFSLCGAPPPSSKQSTTAVSSAAAMSTANNNSTTTKKKMSKNVKKLHKLLLADTDQSYIHARTANMSSSLGLPDGYTMLHAACHVGNVDIVAYLLEYHVRLDVSNDNDNNDDDDNDDDDNEKTTRMLDLNEVDMQGKTALHIASDRGHVDIVLLLREAYNKQQVEESSALLLMSSIQKATKEEEEENVVEGLTKEGEDVDEDEKSTKMASLSIIASTPRATLFTIPKTPGSSGNHNTNSKRKSITPTFSGRHAPVDLSGRTPLGYAATSPAPKARTNRTELEKILYSHGDRSIFGHGGVAERTPPKLRCGPTVQYSPIRSAASVTNSSTRNHQQQRSISSSSSSTIVPTITTTTTTGGYLSPNPRAYLSPKTPRSTSNGTSSRTPPRSTGGGGSRRTTSKTPPKSAISTMSNYATPFQSPHPIIHEDEVYHTGIVVEGQQQGGMTDDDRPSSVVQGRTENKRNMLQWGVSEMNGWRIDMEDKILVEQLSSSNNYIGLFGVFDGHGDGGHASNYIASNIWTKLQTQQDWMTAATRNNTTALQQHNNDDTRAADMFASALTSTCYELDDDLRNDTTRPKDGGTTAIMALICNDHIIVANVGDSRCILVKRIKTTTTTNSQEEDDEKKKEDIVIIPMSEDHKPNLPFERARIESAGLTIQSDIVPVDSRMDNGTDESLLPAAAISTTAAKVMAATATTTTTVVHRVRKSDKNLLGVSRAFGDYDYKSNTELSSMQQAVVCTPEIIIRERVDDEDMYLILACDGIWDVMSNEDVGTFVTRRVNEEMHKLNSRSDGEVLLASVGDDLLAACLEAGSRDNMSVLIVAFPASGLAHVHTLCVTPSLATIGNNSNPLPVVDDATVRVIDFD